MTLDVKFSENNAVIDVDFELGNEEISFSGEVYEVEKVKDPYLGNYDITPLVTAQIMPTKLKTMLDDVRVEMIPTREINNDAGGVTFIVG